MRSMQTWPPKSTTKSKSAERRMRLSSVKSEIKSASRDSSNPEATSVARATLATIVNSRTATTLSLAHSHRSSQTQNQLTALASTKELLQVLTSRMQKTTIRTAR